MKFIAYKLYINLKFWLRNKIGHSIWGVGKCVSLVNPRVQAGLLTLPLPWLNWPPFLSISLKFNTASLRFSKTCCVSWSSHNVQIGMVPQAIGPHFKWVLAPHLKTVWPQGSGFSVSTLLVIVSVKNNHLSFIAVHMIPKCYPRSSNCQANCL